MVAIKSLLLLIGHGSWIDPRPTVIAELYSRQVGQDIDIGILIPKDLIKTMQAR
jgi:hypothetical protein